MPERILHQFTEGAYVGDAVTDQIFAIRRWLRELGFISEIYVERPIPPELQAEVWPARDYRPQPAEACVVHHHAVGSGIYERLRTLGLPQILVYHNITPPQFFAVSNPDIAANLKIGRTQLAEMRPRTRLALGDSSYNEREMRELGYVTTGVLPIVLDEQRYNGPLNEALAARCRAGGPLLLFVGRLAPNKRQEDLIKLYYYLRRLRPDARLALVGNEHIEVYGKWQRELVASLGLDESAVQFTGHVSQQDMVTYYRCADVYVSMSEHEGFGKPLIESMYCGLPVVAYASSAVPDTLGDAGILFYRKEYEALAELVALLVEDEPLRRRVIARQTRRVRAFLEPRVRQQWAGYLRQLDLLPDGATQ